MVRKKEELLISQKKIYNALDGSRFPARKAKLTEQIRCRMGRFQLPEPINHVANRAFNRLVSLQNKVRPAIFVAYMKAILNSWVTERRMRTIQGIRKDSVRKCLLCDAGEDSLEHMSCCRITRSIFNRCRSPINCKTEFFGLHDRCTVNTNMAKHAKGMAILYTVYNALSHHPPELPPLPISELINTAFQCMYA